MFSVRSCYMVEGHECHARRADSGMLVLYTFGIFFFYDSSLPLQEQSIFVSLNDVIAVQSCSLPSKEVAKFVKRATTVGGKCLLIQITDEHQRKNTKLFVGITEIERLIGEIIEVAANTGHTVLPHI
ncbi:hypothetical protein AB6A40_005549 [Gnathostoma spinigerum]|uniref:Uncharacterized protein n=1 Tax=Gnathostoma spinigerum TaxID=75299 RepID=A0ABD6ERF4_9BILA